MARWTLPIKYKVRVLRVYDTTGTRTYHLSYIRQFTLGHTAVVSTTPYYNSININIVNELRSVKQYYYFIKIISIWALVLVSGEWKGAMSYL